MRNHEIHERAMRRAKNFLRSEVELLESIQEVDESEVYLDHDCRNLHEYVAKIMNLGKAVAYNFTAVARKATEVPPLKEVIQSGQLEVQKARKITPVLTQENKGFWLKLAVEQPQKIVEKEVARVRPEAARPERVTYLSATRLNLSVNISENTHELLQRLQDLESQRTRSAASREQAIEESLKAYLEKHDPLEKAKRSQSRVERQTERPNAEAPVADRVYEDFEIISQVMRFLMEDLPLSPRSKLRGERRDLCNHKDMADLSLA
jgi:hypothetical protein